MKTLRKYSKKEARSIIRKDKELQFEFEDLKDCLKDDEDFDYSFSYGNIFSDYDSDTDTTKIIIEWCGDEDDDNFDYEGHQIIADSIEEATIILHDIEEAEGNIIYKV